MVSKGLSSSPTAQTDKMAVKQQTFLLEKTLKLIKFIKYSNQLC